MAEKRMIKVRRPREKTEGDRFNEAFELLINGRWVDAEAKQNFFRYVDGEISHEEAERRLL